MRLPGAYGCSRALVWALLACFAGLFLFCAAQRVPYPFELEWLEGEMICHGLRLLEGLPVYAPPSSRFIAEIYPPVYYYVIADVFRLAGAASFPLLRLVSVASLAGILLLVFLSIRREQGSREASLLACGLFLSCYEIHGAWYDVGRVDMLFFFFLMSGLYALAHWRSRWLGTAGGAVLLVLACYTKQSGVMYLPFAFFYVLQRHRLQGLCFLALTSVLMAVLYWGFDAATGGWFSVYSLDNPMRYTALMNKPLEQIPFKMLFEFRDRIWPEIRYETCCKLPVFFTLAAGFLAYRFLNLTRRSRLGIWELTAVPAVISYFSIRPHLGSEKNDFMYLTLWGSMLLGLMLARVSAASFAVDSRKSLKTVLYLLLASQLFLNLYDPRSLVPAPGSREKGSEIIGLIRAMPGQVYLPYHSYYGIMAGKDTIMNGGAYWAWQILGEKPYRPDDLIEKIKSKYFSAIIIDDRAYMTYKGDRVFLDNWKLFTESGDPVAEAAKEFYEPGGRLPYDDHEQFRDRTGLQTRPELIMVPKRQ